MDIAQAWTFSLSSKQVKLTSASTFLYTVFCLCEMFFQISEGLGNAHHSSVYAHMPLPQSAFDPILTGSSLSHFFRSSS